MYNDSPACTKIVSPYKLGIFRLYNDAVYALGWVDIGIRLKLKLAFTGTPIILGKINKKIKIMA